jgi:large subunit ribosomal protein L25
VDLLIVRRGERVTVDVQLHLLGEPGTGTLVNIELNALSIEVEATAIPGRIDLDIDGAQAGTQVHASDVILPAGATLVTDPDALVLSVATVVELEPEEPAEGEAAEGEAPGAGEPAVAGDES